MSSGRRSPGSIGRSPRPPQNAKSKRNAEGRAPLTRQELEQTALSYINRFDVTAKKLRQHLMERARKAGAQGEAEAWISELVERYLGSGVLDDARFAKNLASRLTSRGKSSRAISQKLALRGVPGDVAAELMATRRQDEPDAELDAARAYVRKRRLGPYRGADKSAEYRNKDLASLARQGFSFDIARKALGPGPGRDDEF